MGRIIHSSIMLLDIEKKLTSIELKQIRCFLVNFIQSLGENIEIDR
jgi:hypothetical protein